MILGYIKDLREASAHILLGLGYPVSISPDDPGKFGYCDTTLDYFAIAVAYNWGINSNDEKEIMRVSVINDGGQMLFDSVI